VSAHHDNHRDAPAPDDLAPTEEQAREVKGGTWPIEPGGSGSSGFSLSRVGWRMRRGKRRQARQHSPAGGRPV
jgi:hypothetical protein